MSNQQIIDTPKNWNAASKGYAEKVAPILMESYTDAFLHRLDANNSHEAIEVAAGTGALTIDYAQKVKTLLATDFSPKMLEFAKKKTELTGLKNVSFAIMDGQSLNVEDNSKDRAACSFAMMLFPDKQKGFSELYRVLRPGGKALVSAWAGPEKFEGFGIFLSAMQKAFPDLPKPTSPPPVFSLSDLDVFKEQMEAAGFKNVEVEYIDKDITVNGFDEFWSMLTTGAPPIKLFFDKVGTFGKDKIRNALAEIVEQRFGDGLITLTNTATVGTGNK